MTKSDEILKFWFGQVEETIVPSEYRAKIWFAEDEKIDQEIRDLFSEDLTSAIAGKYTDWENTARGQLALIILLDQLTRHIYRYSWEAYAQDEKAIKICLFGIKNEFDHELSLIERVFYYFPLLHSEDLIHQERSIQAYQILQELAFTETRIIYESFLKFAHHHYSIIHRFGRFPQRNQILKRESTPEEIIYLQEISSRSSSESE